MCYSLAALKRVGPGGVQILIFRYEEPELFQFLNILHYLATILRYVIIHMSPHIQIIFDGFSAHDVLDFLKQKHASKGSPRLDF